MLSEADRIRQFVIQKIAEPARRQGKAEFEVRAGDVHRALGLTNKMPSVCSAIGGNRFREEAGVRLVSRTGPLAGANVYFRFAFGAASEARPVPVQVAHVALHPVEERLARMPPAPGVPVDFTDAVILVSCVKSKRTIPAPARDLYTSALFQGGRRYAESKGTPWYILSALHGLVEPETVIAPYEVTLKNMGIAERRQWATKVLAALLPKLAGKRRVIFLAGDRYREFLIGPLQAAGLEIVVPMEGLALGEQLAWLNAQP